MRTEQEARAPEAPAPAGGNAAAKGAATYTDEVQRVGALLRGEKPKREPSTPAVDKGDADHKPNGEDKDNAGDAAARADEDKGDKAGGDKEQPRPGDSRGGDAGEDSARGGEGEAGEPERVTPAELARALGVKEGELFDNLVIPDVDLVDAAGNKS